MTSYCGPNLLKKIAAHCQNLNVEFIIYSFNKYIKTSDVVLLKKI